MAKAIFLKQTESLKEMGKKKKHFQISNYLKN